MSRLRPLWLMLIAACAALAGVIITALMAYAGYSSPALPLSSVITLIAVGLVVLVLGIIVWRDQRRIARAEAHWRAEQKRDHQERPSSPLRTKRRIHPLHAARVAAAAQACAYAGALIAGWHAGVLLHLGPAGGMGAPNATSSLVMMIGGLFWVIIGFVVEAMCTLPPDQGRSEDDDGGAGAASGPEFGGHSDPGYASAATLERA